MHLSVMLFELLKYLDIKSNGIYFDCTFGYGGHSIELFKYLSSDGMLFAIDKDKHVFQHKKFIFNKAHNIIFYNCSFNYIDIISYKNDLVKKIDGIFLDLGVSLDHFSDISRGFGFSYDGFFDLRLDIEQNIRAIDWINFSNIYELYCTFSFIDNKKLIRNIIVNIFFFRKKKKIKTVNDFFKIILKTCINNNINSIYINKIFYSIRVFINNENFLLFDFLNKSISLLKSKGILLLISFNSIEDKLIKNFFLNKKEIKFKISFLKPSIFELNINYSSRSAIMRIFYIK